MKHLQKYENFVEQRQNEKLITLLPGIRQEKTFKLTDELDVVDDNMLFTLPKDSQIKIVKIVNKIVYFIYNGKVFHTHQAKLQNYI